MYEKSYMWATNFHLENVATGRGFLYGGGGGGITTSTTQTYTEATDMS